MAYDAVIVGSGPNGLTAAAIIARTGRRVLVIEAADDIGGGTQTQELTLPGFRSDVCSAIHPFGYASPAFEDLDLTSHGLVWVHPDVPLAHPLDGGRATFLHRSVEATAAGLGVDAAAWRSVFLPHAQAWEDLRRQLLGPVRLPRRPLALSRFALEGIQSTQHLTTRRFAGDDARALFAGASGHAFLPVGRALSAAFGLLLHTAGQTGGWPLAQGGSRAITDALASVVQMHGGEITTSWRVRSLRELPKCELVLLDTSPQDALRIVGNRAPRRVRSGLGTFRRGPGVFKLDYALDAPIPWAHQDVQRAGTVHVGGTYQEIASAENEVAAGRHPERPLVILAQPTLFDPTRAPKEKHVAWAYCHVPNGSPVDMTHAIENQIERFAPGFRERVLVRSARGPLDMEAHNRNLVGGDIAGGANNPYQMVARPRLAVNPYLLSSSNPLVYLCSASTPPGGGVHGMCGYHAARFALRRLDGRRDVVDSR